MYIKKNIFRVQNTLKTNYETMQECVISKTISCMRSLLGVLRMFQLHFFLEICDVDYNTAITT